MGGDAAESLDKFGVGRNRNPLLRPPRQDSGGAGWWWDERTRPLSHPLQEERGEGSARKTRQKERGPVASVEKDSSRREREVKGLSQRYLR